jgi:two-component system, response regulator PdtaR
MMTSDRRHQTFPWGIAHPGFMDGIAEGLLPRRCACCAIPHTFFRHGRATDALNPTFGLRAHATWIVGVFMVPPVVLVVEDEVLVRMNAVSLLEEAGFGVLEAGTADDAIALLESRQDIRIVFTDINMPGSMDGLRLAHAIRNRWPPIELVLTSGQMRVRNEDMPERGLFLSKPYDPGELVEAVRSLAVQ